ncbi:PEPxxWA-CTERM sorting domain-containing protein [Phenylobacterium sp. Root700]|uniref:PEPxxWA-CTERM sorting domain-containing protein n=1 Tax=Phenylobacterium sp. Root700 TaxID=1736591 RepID=UPI0009E9E285|nr:PEPxxWA-CTERM sorting domain-containing protein [Phenylobacterium sp. Root700]
MQLTERRPSSGPILKHSRSAPDGRQREMQMNKLISAACATAALFLSASAANAATVYQTTFQGATFTVTQNSNTNVTFDIAGANALTGDWAGAQFLGAFSFKGLGASNLTATQIGGGGASVNAVAGGLNASGCNGAGSGFVCFDYAPNVAANTSHLTFDLTANSGAFNFASTGPHLKILWTNSGTLDNKIGDLFSQDIPFSPGGAVPEPATWAMMIVGFGLAGSAVRRRRHVLAHA